MKILKYIFLLILLTLITLTVFIATQKGNFAIERSKIIKTPKVVLYNYVNDYKNWETFGSWLVEDTLINKTYAPKTIGNGASMAWENSENTGSSKTIGTQNDTKIVQKMDFDGTVSDVTWIFKDTIGGTKVTLKSKGEMSFLFKVYTALNGGADKIIGTMYEQTLLNLNKILDFEANTFEIKVNGVVKKTETNYIRQTFTSEISKIRKNFRIVIPKLVKFSEQNNLQTIGKPFIIYHTYDEINGLARISICIPISKEIFTSSGSDILTGKLNEFDAVKTTLTGDYSHIKDAITQTTNYITTQKLSSQLAWSHLEVYSISKSETNSPSKWVTEIYYPLKPKVVPVAKPIYVPRAVEPEPEQLQPEQETSEF